VCSITEREKYHREGEKMRIEGKGFSLIEILIVMGVLSILAIVFTT
jgi:prepilin-type N-terminal cleavage/methylation domain-containing protein